MNFARTIAVSALALLGMASFSVTSAQAQERWIDVYNNTNQSIFYVYMSPVGPSPWGRDLLGDDIIYSGESYRVEPRQRTGSCIFRMKVEFENGRSIESRRFNACEATEAQVSRNRISVN